MLCVCVCACVRVSARTHVYVCMYLCVRALACTHAQTRLNTLQHTATKCNTLQHTAIHCNTLQYTATHCNTLQHTHDHGNPTPLPAAAHCSTLQHTDYRTLHACCRPCGAPSRRIPTTGSPRRADWRESSYRYAGWAVGTYTAPPKKKVKMVVSHWNAAWGSRLAGESVVVCSEWSIVCCSVLQCVAVCCSVLQCIVVYCSVQ